MQSQVVEKPNFLLKSHETLELKSITQSEKATVVRLELTNFREGGAFCIDKGTKIVLPGGRSLKLENVMGMPECPENYIFATIGEKVLFTLTFDGLPEGTPWINIIEGCDDNCISIYGIVLDNGLNQRIDNAYKFIDDGAVANAITEFESILEKIRGSGHMYEAALYSVLIEIAREEGDSKGYERYINELASLRSPGATLAMNNLKVRGIIK